MSRPRIAALVCEGQTDVPIYREALLTIWPELEEVLCLQPEIDTIGRAQGSAGWTAVKAWCEANAGKLSELTDPDIGDPIDLLLIAIDLDIAIEAEIENPPRDLGSYETTRLKNVIRTWLRTSSNVRLPSVLCISTPVMAIEAWIIAARYPKERAPETIRDPAAWLTEKHVLRRSPANGKPWKELYLYKNFAIEVAKKLSVVRRKCPEAARTFAEIERRRTQLSKA